MRNSIYELSFDELMQIREEICNIYDRYRGVKEPKISRNEYQEYFSEMLNKYNINVRSLNRIRVEYYYATRTEHSYSTAKETFDKYQKQFLKAQKREETKMDLLKEQMRKELMAELGL